MRQTAGPFTQRLIVWLALSATFLLAAASATGQARRQSPLDSNWHFIHADPADAEKLAYDDNKWRTLDVPHDWSIEGPFDQKNATGGAGAFLPSGVGW